MYNSASQARSEQAKQRTARQSNAASNTESNTQAAVWILLACGEDRARGQCCCHPPTRPDADPALEEAVLGEIGKRLGGRKAVKLGHEGEGVNLYAPSKATGKGPQRLKKL